MDTLAKIPWNAIVALVALFIAALSWWGRRERSSGARIDARIDALILAVGKLEARMDKAATDVSHAHTRIRDMRASREVAIRTEGRVK
jgi:hypothetical protein